MPWWPVKDFSLHVWYRLCFDAYHSATQTSGMIPQYLHRGYPVRVGVHVYAIKDSDKLNLALILIKKIVLTPAGIQTLKHCISN